VGKLPRSKAAPALAPNGTFVTIAALDTKEKLDNLVFVRDLIEAGQLKAVIDRCYPLEQMVAAHHYTEAGRKRGNVVIAVASECPTNVLDDDGQTQGTLRGALSAVRS
jgi:hypothetical protein